VSLFKLKRITKFKRVVDEEFLQALVKLGIDADMYYM